MSELSERIATSIDPDMLTALHDLAVSDVLPGDAADLAMKILHAELKAYWKGLPDEWKRDTEEQP